MKDCDYDFSKLVDELIDFSIDVNFSILEDGLGTLLHNKPTINLSGIDYSLSGPSDDLEKGITEAYINHSNIINGDSRFVYDYHFDDLGLKVKEGEKPLFDLYDGVYTDWENQSGILWARDLKVYHISQLEKLDGTTIAPNKDGSNDFSPNVIPTEAEKERINQLEEDLKAIGPLYVGGGFPATNKNGTTLPHRSFFNSITDYIYVLEHEKAHAERIRDGIDFNSKACESPSTSRGLTHQMIYALEELIVHDIAIKKMITNGYSEGDLDKYHEYERYYNTSARAVYVIAKEAGLLEQVKQELLGCGDGCQCGCQMMGPPPPPFWDKKPDINDPWDNAKRTSSPLVLDLNGNGISTTSLDNGVYFDHDGNGFARKSGWLSKGEGILALDRNDNGVIDDGGELFGNNTLLANGKYAINGFEALKAFDINRDGVIDEKDAIYKDLKVWVDNNGDAFSDKDELLTLEEAGVKSINLGYINSNYVDEHGNAHKQQGSFTKSDGTTAVINDVWFSVDYTGTINIDISQIATR